MKERPILFSGPMVRALLDGSKTQTRRVVKAQPPMDCGFVETAFYNPIVIDRNGDEQPGPEIFGAYSEDGSWGCKCPYGAPGDLLWVRETAKCGYRSEQPPSNTGRIGVDYKAGGSLDRKYALEHRDDYPWFPSRSHNADGLIRWAPAIHMPRWASRIALEVTGVRVERLQDISYEDALSEGVADFAEMLSNEPSSIGETPEETARRLRWPQRWFESLWTDINGADSWNANPLVWVVEFRRLSA